MESRPLSNLANTLRGHLKVLSDKSPAVLKLGKSGDGSYERLSLASPSDCGQAKSQSTSRLGVVFHRRRKVIESPGPQCLDTPNSSPVIHGDSSANLAISSPTLKPYFDQENSFNVNVSVYEDSLSSGDEGDGLRQQETTPWNQTKVAASNKLTRALRKITNNKPIGFNRKRVNGLE